ncbi:MAG: hypothetical protein ACK5E3_03625 [Planctomycetota bacterium]
MKQSPKHLSVFLFLALCSVCSLVGCGSSTASIQGSVSYDGAPIQKGMITFTPADGKGSVVGCNIQNGKYAASGVTPGKNFVNVAAVKEVTFSRSSEEMEKMAASGKGKGPIEGLIDPADIVPPNAKGNGAEHMVNEGSNTIDLQLTKP